MAIQGVRDLSDFLAGERPFQWDKRINLLYPSGAGKNQVMLCALKHRLGGGDVASDIRYEWFEEIAQMMRFRINANFTDSATTINFKDNLTAAERAEAGEAGNQQNYGAAAVLKAGDLLYIEATEEIVQVAANPTSASNVSAVSVSRGIGGTAAAAYTSGTAVNPHAVHIGSAMGEISKAPVGRVFKPTQLYNYIQIHRESAVVSRIAQAVETRTEDPMKQEMRRATHRLLLGIERDFWFGTRSDTGIPNATSGDLANQGIAYTSNGIKAQIPTSNMIAAPSGGLVDMDWFDEQLRKTFSGFGSQEKVAFCGSHAVMALNQAADKSNSRGRWQMSPPEKWDNVNITKLMTGMGTLVIVHHPLFDRAPTQFNSDGTVKYAGMSSDMYVLDMMNLQHRYLNPAKGGLGKGGIHVTHYQKAIDNTNGSEDADRYSLMYEGSLKVMQPSTHWRWHGLVGGQSTIQRTQAVT